jgi:hypothetical protein
MSAEKGNSIGRVRAVHGYADVDRFLDIATQEELSAYVKGIPRDEELLLERVFLPSMRRSGSAERSLAGRPPRVPISAKRFLELLRGFAEGKAGKAYTREAVVQEFQEIGHVLRRSGPFIGYLWDKLPTEYQKKRVLQGATLKMPHTRSHSKTRGLKGGAARRRTRTRSKPVAGFAVVHSEEKPWVKEPNYQRWLGKLRRHTVKVRREGDVEHPDNLCVDSNICKGDLGIPRRLMPQFTTPRDVRSFMAFAERLYGVKSRRATRRAGQLRPSQEEINRERVENVKEEIVAKKLNPNVPLIVSRDGYVIDGHHRWAAYKSHEPSKKMPVLVVGAPARDVLSIAATWGAKHHQF